MKRLGLKDYVILGFALAFLVVLIVLLTKEDNSQENFELRQTIKLKEDLIDTLVSKNAKLDIGILNAWHDAIEANKVIDTLKLALKNRKPIIKYIKKELKDEIEKPIIMPSNTLLDSLFTSKLQGR